MELPPLLEMPQCLQSNINAEYPPFPLLIGEHPLLLSKTIDGSSVVTNFRFCIYEQNFINIPLMMVCDLLVSEAAKRLRIGCKNGSTYSCTFATTEDCQACTSLLREKTGQPQSFSDLFAYRFHAMAVHKQGLGTKLTRLEETHISLCQPVNPSFAYNFNKEMQRLQFDTSKQGAWRKSHANKNYEFCPTYPKFHILPAAVDDDRLKVSLDFRALKRFPSVVWRDKRTGMVLIRSSQPLSSFLGVSYFTNHADVALVEEIVNACNRDWLAIVREERKSRHSLQEADAHKDCDCEGEKGVSCISGCLKADRAQSVLHEKSSVSAGRGTINGGFDSGDGYIAKKLAIVDCRSLAGVWGNSFKGGGTEDEAIYKCNTVHLDLANIHSMRDSFNKLRILCHTCVEGTFLKNLSSCSWPSYISALLRGANIVVELMNEMKRPVLVHCSDGWDRTSQIVSLSELMMDSYYRTLEGFQVLVEKEWLHFGHKFGERGGHDPNCSDTNQISPIFLQFLDCVYQLVLQNSAKFQFNEAYLVKLLQHSYACLFGNFLHNCQRERDTCQQKTASVWALLSPENVQFVNLLYKPSDQVLMAKSSEHDIVPWNSVYMGSCLRISHEDLFGKSSPAAAGNRPDMATPEGILSSMLSKVNSNIEHQHIDPDHEVAAAAAVHLDMNHTCNKSSSTELLHSPRETPQADRRASPSGAPEENFPDSSSRPQEHFLDSAGALKENFPDSSSRPQEHFLDSAGALKENFPDSSSRPQEHFLDSAGALKENFPDSSSRPQEHFLDSAGALKENFPDSSGTLVENFSDFTLKENFPDITLKENFPESTMKNFPDCTLKETFPDCTLKENFPESTMKNFPDCTLKETFPDCTLKENFPVSTLKENFPDCTLEENFPDSTLKENFPDCTLEENFPDSTLKENFPDSTLKENFPDCTLEENFPDSTLKENFPDSTLKENFPDYSLEENFPDCTLKENFPDSTLKENFPDCTLEENFPDIAERLVENFPDSSGILSPGVTSRTEFGSKTVASTFQAGDPSGKASFTQRIHQSSITATLSDTPGKDPQVSTEHQCLTRPGEEPVNAAADREDGGAFLEVLCVDQSLVTSSECCLETEVSGKCHGDVPDSDEAGNTINFSDNSDSFEADKIETENGNGNNSEIPEEGNINPEISEDRNINTEISEDGNINTEIPEDGNINTDISEDGNINTEIPEDGNINTEIPEDGNINTEIPEDGNINSEIPEDGNVKREIPEDGNMNTEIPEDGNIHSEIPEDGIKDTENPESFEASNMNSSINNLNSFELENSNNFEAGNININNTYSFQAGKTNIDKHDSFDDGNAKLSTGSFEAGNTHIDSFEAGNTHIDSFEAGNTHIDSFEAGNTHIDSFEAGNTHIDSFEAGNTHIDSFEAGNTACSIDADCLEAENTNSNIDITEKQNIDYTGNKNIDNLDSFEARNTNSSIDNGHSLEAENADIDHDSFDAGNTNMDDPNNFEAWNRTRSFGSANSFQVGDMDNDMARLDSYEIGTVNLASYESVQAETLDSKCANVASFQTDVNSGDVVDSSVVSIMNLSQKISMNGSATSGYNSEKMSLSSNSSSLSGETDGALSDVFEGVSTADENCQMEDNNCENSRMRHNSCENSEMKYNNCENNQIGHDCCENSEMKYNNCENSQCFVKLGDSSFTATVEDIPREGFQRPEGSQETTMDSTNLFSCCNSRANCIHCGIERPICHNSDLFLFNSLNSVERSNFSSSRTCASCDVSVDTLPEEAEWRTLMSSSMSCYTKPLEVTTRQERPPQNKARASSSSLTLHTSPKKKRDSHQTKMSEVFYESNLLSRLSGTAVGASQGQNVSTSCLSHRSDSGRKHHPSGSELMSRRLLKATVATSTSDISDSSIGQPSPYLLATPAVKQQPRIKKHIDVDGLTLFCDERHDLLVELLSEKDSKILDLQRQLSQAWRWIHRLKKYGGRQLQGCVCDNFAVDSNGSECNTLDSPSNPASDVSWETVDESVTRMPPWVSDLTVTHCARCNDQFGLSWWKHHCRNCGIFLSSTALTQETELNKPEQVCRRCHSQLPQLSPGASSDGRIPSLVADG